MSAKSWGTLIARLLATYFVIAGLQIAVPWMDSRLFENWSDAPKDWFFGVLLHFAIAGVLWFKANRFAPVDEGGDGEDAQGQVLAIVVVAGTACYIAFYPFVMVTADLLQRLNPPASFTPEPVASIVVQALILIALIWSTCNARKVMRWLTR